MIWLIYNFLDEFQRIARRKEELSSAGKNPIFHGKFVIANINVDNVTIFAFNCPMD